MEAAFEQAARAMFAIMAEGVAGGERVAFDFCEDDLELALATWLNGLLAEARLHGLALGEFRLRRDGRVWRGEAWGKPWREIVERGTEVKGATLTMLRVARESEGWVARCVVDV